MPHEYVYKISCRYLQKWLRWGIPGQIDQRLTPSYFKKIWNLVYGVVWQAEDDWANIGALQARVNEL